MWSAFHTVDPFPSTPSRCAPILMDEDLRIARTYSADVANTHCLERIHRIWARSDLFAYFAYVVFLSFCFQVRSSTIHPSISSFTLGFSSLNVAAPSSYFLRARYRAPYYDSVNFLHFGLRCPSSFAVRVVSPAGPPLRSSLYLSPSPTHFCA